MEPLTTHAADSAGVQVAVLYGSPVFQVRVWELAAGAEIPAHPAGQDERSHNFLLSGVISLDGGGMTGQPALGQRFELSGRAAARVCNPGAYPARLLEVCWGQNFTPVPLVEITETRPWGSFTVLKDEPDYKLKQLTVNPGNRLSLQRHARREEHWLVTQGAPEVTLNEGKHRLQAGEYIHIPQHSWHRISNPALAGGEGGVETVEIVELQLGDYFGEDDIERREDDYGRA